MIGSDKSSRVHVRKVGAVEESVHPIERRVVIIIEEMQSNKSYFYLYFV